MKSKQTSEAIKQLYAGHKDFKQKHYELTQTYDSLVEKGQQPKVLVIACSDSRVDPAIIFNTNPGDLFVVRNVANLIPPYEADIKHHGTSAAIEFAVMFLKVSDIVILGHSQCGGVQALMEETNHKQQESFIIPWMDIARKSKKTVQQEFPTLSPAEQAHQCERISMLQSIENLRTFPWIKQKEEANELAIHAWHFNMATGDIDEVY